MAIGKKNSILIITTLIAFSIFLNYLVNDSKLDPSIELAILGREGKAEKYFPSNSAIIPINTQLNWTLYLSNTLNSTNRIQIRAKFGDQTIPPPNTTLCTPCPIDPFYTTTLTLKENEWLKVPFKFSISGYELENNTITQVTVNDQPYSVTSKYETIEKNHIVFEVWTYNNNLKDYMFTWREGERTYCVWNQLRFSVKIS